MFTYINIIVFLLLIFFLSQLKKKKVGFKKRVVIALFLGVLLGLLFHFFYFGTSHYGSLVTTIGWINLFGLGYIRLLEMVMIPAIATSIFVSLINLNFSDKIGKMTLWVISLLLFGAFLGASVGSFTTLSTHFDGKNLISQIPHEKDENIERRLTSQFEKTSKLSLSEQILTLIPTSLFSNENKGIGTSTIGITLFALLLGIATLKRKIKNSSGFESFVANANSFGEGIHALVQMIIRLTPYGIFALTTRLFSTIDLKTLKAFFDFIVINYIALFITLVIQLIILFSFKVNPLTYLKKAFPALSFGFISRSSLATLPLTLESLERLGVSKNLSSITSSLGLSIGPVACAGIYPAIVSIIAAPSLGLNPLNAAFIIKMLVIVTIASIGVAGVGGGAIMSSLFVFSLLHFPLELIILLIPTDPIIDMGRTAMNINGTLFTGTISSKILNEFNKETFLTN
jgi:L-cystine uptake protein TcyP (sodium:dicarboxylate symporter family)